MKKVLRYGLVIVIILVVIVLGINFYVIFSTKDQIIEEGTEIEDFDCILVLGAGVSQNKPSLMLEDRLKKAIDLYKMGVANKIIMSGDHSRTEYDEVNIMKDYAINAGVPSSDIFMDHAGFSTYESIYRANAIFEAEKVVIVTQEYHLYRAIHIANKLGIDAYGVMAEKKNYAGSTYRELREVVARNKDFVKSIFKPKPTYLGEVIPVSGNGDVTNDKI